jgi:hypothetical protein
MAERETGAQVRAGDVASAKAERSGEAAEAAATRTNFYNLLWELTQAFLAIALTVATIYSSLKFGDTNTVIDADGRAVSVPVPETLKNALFVVLGFYFGRTNHARPTRGGNGNGDPPQVVV